MNSPVMRAKLRVHSIDRTHQGKEGDTYRSIRVSMAAVARSDAYPADGHDDDNTYAKWSPSADFTIHINNPALFDKLTEGEKFYVDFTRATEPAAQAVT